MTIQFSRACRRFVDDMLAEEMTGIEKVAAMLPPPDPFGLDHDCLNPGGHDPHLSCGELVCRHCARIFR
jgi:hypothetical protein